MNDRIKKEKERWKNKMVDSAVKRHLERKELFTTVSGKPIKDLYTPADIPEIDYLKKLSFPGMYPFTRGIKATMYRGRLWTMRQFSGFATAEESNRRYRLLLERGQTGLSVAFDLPTLMGYDSDHLLAIGEVGKCGVAVDSLQDMETLFDGIPLGKVTTSMTINAPAAILLAMYIAVAEKQGVKPDHIGGTVQNDILKEYIAQKEWIFPPLPSMRIITDMFAYCSKEIPRWNTISISGYHIREAGATAVQELAFTLADGIAYAQAGIDAGLEIDEFAPRLSFFFNSHNDLFEEVAKFRAARRIWAKVMKERFKAKKERSWWLRFHTQTAGCSLTAQQIENNIVRVTIQALAGILGGTQSLHTNSKDEALAVPAEEAATTALRTQQILAYESGVVNTIDPLGGSYFVEKLTDEMEEEAWGYINKIDEMGGMIAAIERGFPQKEIMEAAYRYQQAIEKKEKIIVGVNEFLMEEEEQPPFLMIDSEVERAKQIKKLQALRSKRNNSKVKECLKRLRLAARGKENLMPFILESVKAYAFLGEIVDVLREEFGEYQEPSVF
ncbi:methylmalonyl-CoA mutase [bacterium (candidate division B38) B3_B38]|nr:MAG: methylmalonyl-CoA mutase [bacterium (candidate division B38) B3_B38]